MFLTGNIKVQVNLLHLPASANLLIVKSIICCKNQKHFNQFTMSLSFCVMDFILVCTYEKAGENPELLIYKKR